MRENYNYNINPQGLVKIKLCKIDDNLSRIVDIIDGQLQKKESVNVFEPGCGGGRNLEFLKNKYGNRINIFGSDISAVAIDYAKNKSGIAGNFVIAKTIEDCFTDKFDLIIMLDILEHLPSIEEVDETLRLAKKKLDNLGTLFISCPIEMNKFSICWFFKKINFWKDLTLIYYGHTIEFTEDLILDIVKKYFNISSVTYGLHFLLQFNTFLFFYIPKQIMRFWGGEKMVSSFRQSNLEISAHDTLRYFLVKLLFKTCFVITFPCLIIGNYESKLRKKSKFGAMNIQIECH